MKSNSHLQALTTKSMQNPCHLSHLKMVSDDPQCKKGGLPNPLQVIFSDWQGFCQPARFQVGVERGRVQVIFCIPGVTSLQGRSGLT